MDTLNVLLLFSTARSFIWNGRKYVATRGNSITGAPNYNFFQTKGFNWNHKGEPQTAVVHILLAAWCFCIQQDGNKRMRKLLFKLGLKNAETLLWPWRQIKTTSYISKENRHRFLPFVPLSTVNTLKMNMVTWIMQSAHWPRLMSVLTSWTTFAFFVILCLT